MLKVVHDETEVNATTASTPSSSLLDEIVRDGARQTLVATLQAEVAAYIRAHADEVDGHGWRLVVRNGYHAPREVTTAAGAVPVKQPRVNDKRIDPVTGVRFSSPILPAWCRKSPPGERSVAAALSARPVHQRLRPGVGAVPGHAHADHHQQADLVVLEADLEVDAVEPAQDSRAANSSNDPTRQQVKLKSRDALIHRC